MEIRDREIVLSEGLGVQWDAVRTLKVLNNKLLFALRDGLTVEVAGLSGRSVDEIFLAYYKYLNLHPVGA